MKSVRRVALVLFFWSLPWLLLSALLLPHSSFSARPQACLFLGLGAAGGLALLPEKPAPHRRKPVTFCAAERWGRRPIQREKAAFFRL